MKTKTLALHLAVVCVLPFALACAKKKEEKKTELAITAPKLDGDYTTGCVGAANFSQISRLRFGQIRIDDKTNEDRVMMSTLDFNGNTCGSATATTDVTFKYTIGAHRGGNVFDAYFEETEYSMTPETIEVADAWNRRRVCDRNDWNAGTPRVIDKRAGNCVQDDNINKRPIYSVIKIEADKISLGVKTREQDGLTPERRLTNLGSAVHARTATSPVNPTPINSCLALDGIYACTQGDGLFAGNDLNVANDRNQNLVQMSISKNGQHQEMQIYRPSEGERHENKGGFRFSTRDICDASQLVNTTTVSRGGDLRNRNVTERTFKIDSRRSLIIDTVELDFTNDVAGAPRRAHTECVRRN